MRQKRKKKKAAALLLLIQFEGQHLQEQQRLLQVNNCIIVFCKLDLDISTYSISSRFSVNVLANWQVNAKEETEANVDQKIAVGAI